MEDISAGISGSLITCDMIRTLEKQKDQRSLIPRNICLLLFLFNLLPLAVLSHAAPPEIAAGWYHTLAIKADGSLWTWGDNRDGQLGNGTRDQKHSPAQIESGDAWVSVTAGSKHSLGIQSDGTLWSWGDNTYGQLGDGTTSDQLSPVQVGSDDRWVSIAAGGNHSLGIQSDGTLWAWGDNYTGQVGDGTTEERHAPVQIGTETTWISVAAGNSHTLALQSDNTLWAWGNNRYGQLGDGTAVSRHSPILIGTNRVKIAAGHNHSLGISVGGTLWVWGLNWNGQLGDGTKDNRFTPVEIGCCWSSVAGGSYHTVAKSDGTLWTWGNNEYGQLGDGTTAERPLPLQIGSDGTWSLVSAGGYHSAALKEDNTFWTWGNNTYGQIGDVTTVHRHSPVNISNISYYCDDDGDGHIDESADGLCTGFGCEPAECRVEIGDDCDDTEPDINAEATEVCDGIDNNCNDSIDEGFDTDSDGYTTCGGDCNDSDALVNPGMMEIPYNGKDDDCDPLTPDDDLDGDGFILSDDCDDGSADVYPGGIEVCDGRDNDCDGTLDEGFGIDFSDIQPDHWAVGNIHAIACAGITTGCGNSNYCPSDLVTRDQMAAFIIRAIEGEPPPDYCGTSAPFSDVPSGHWACRYIKRLSELGITTGCGDGNFCPLGNVTRAEMAAFLIRAKFGEDFTYPVSPFFWDVSGAHWAFRYVQRLRDENITTGCTALRYCPGDNVTRAEMAAFLSRAFLGM